MTREPEHPSPTPDSEPRVPMLEIDDSVPPRPEEEIADALRAVPDVADDSARAG